MFLIFSKAINQLCKCNIMLMLIQSINQLKSVRSMNRLEYVKVIVESKTSVYASVARQTRLAG